MFVVVVVVVAVVVAVLVVVVAAICFYGRCRHRRDCGIAVTVAWLLLGSLLSLLLSS